MQINGVPTVAAKCTALVSFDIRILEREINLTNCGNVVLPVISKQAFEVWHLTIFLENTESSDDPAMITFSL